MLLEILNDVLIHDYFGWVVAYWSLFELKFGNVILNLLFKEVDCEHKNQQSEDL